MAYGYLVFQKRITLISKRSGEHFGSFTHLSLLRCSLASLTSSFLFLLDSDEIVFPVLISVAIFIAILTNFILRIIEL